MNLSEFNHGDQEKIIVSLLKCCGSSKWAKNIILARPFSSIDNLINFSEKVWLELDKDDYLEAFAAHPKIGEKKPPEISINTEKWTRKEQSGMTTATYQIRQELEKNNLIYEKKFGYIFIICATGKSGKEMLELLKIRIGNNPMTEIMIAAQEQNKITKLRIRKLIDDK